MAALQKTWSGDLTQHIAGEILKAINNYEEEERLKEASPKVRQAARELRKEDPDVKKVQSPSTAIVVKESLIPVHVKVEQLDKEVKKISGKVTAIGTGLADTNKLIGDQNAMLEAKFDIMLGLLRARGAGEEEIKDGVTGGGGTSGTGAIVPVSKNFGGKPASFGLGFLTRAYGGKIIKRTLKFLRRRIIPRRLRAGARLLRMKGKRFLRPITRQLSKVRPKNLMRAGAQRFIRSGIGRKISQKLGIKAATRIGSKTAAKSLAKKIPIAGALFGTGFAIQRAMKGEWTAAGLEFASGVASIFPGVGTGISVGLDAGLMAYDINKEMQRKTPVVPEREIGSGIDVMGMFKQASSLLLSSMMPIAASAGTLPEVKGQIKAAGLDGVEIARMQPPTGINIGRGGKKVSLPAPPEPTVAKIPPLPKLPGVTGGDDRNIFQKGLDWTKDKIGGAWNWTKEKAGQAWNWIKEGTKANVEKVKAFVSNTAETINNSEIANKVREVIGSEKGDGFIGPKWMGIKNPFAKKVETNVTPETTIEGGEKNKSASGGDYDQLSGARAILEIDPNITTMGAAYLSGNIQQESSWNGMRSWGQVLGDGTSRNGGLVSWASWKDDPARLGAIEKDYGKKIDEITEHEQLKWMIKELKTSYPGAYKIFTSEDSSVEDLKKASKWYWGYGHEGERFNYADSIYKQLQNVETESPDAEKGAILPSTEISMKSHQVKESSAVVDEIEDYEPPQPIVYLTNSNVSTKPLVIIKKKSSMNDFVEQYRFMSLGAA